MLTLISTRPIFFELGLDRMLNVLQEALAIAVDVLDAHRRDHLPELPEDDVFGLLLDLLRVESQQTNGGVLHDFGLNADRHGKDAGNLDANVLGRKSVFERNADLDRLQIEVSVVLNNGDDKCGAPVNAHRGCAAAHFSEFDEDPIAGAALVALGKHHPQADDKQADDDGPHAEVSKGTQRRVFDRCQ